MGEALWFSDSDVRFSGDDGSADDDGGAMVSGNAARFSGLNGYDARLQDDAIVPAGVSPWAIALRALLKAAQAEAQRGIWNGPAQQRLDNFVPQRRPHAR